MNVITGTETVLARDHQGADHDPDRMTGAVTIETSNTKTGTDTIEIAAIGAEAERGTTETEAKRSDARHQAATPKHELQRI